jgi:hypothetical protein
MPRTSVSGRYPLNKVAILLGKATWDQDRFLAACGFALARDPLDLLVPLP